MGENERLLETTNLDEGGNCPLNDAARQGQRHRLKYRKEYVKRIYSVFLHTIIVLLFVLLARPLPPVFAVDGITSRKPTFLLI